TSYGDQLGVKSVDELTSNTRIDGNGSAVKSWRLVIGLSAALAVDKSSQRWIFEGIQRDQLQPCEWWTDLIFFNNGPKIPSCYLVHSHSSRSPSRRWAYGSTSAGPRVRFRAVV